MDSVNNNRIITLENVDFVRDGKEILKDVNFTVNRGDFVAVTGPNGGGKTTLLRLILKLLIDIAQRFVKHEHIRERNQRTSQKSALKLSPR